MDCFPTCCDPPIEKCIQASIEDILCSEAGIARCLEDLFCNGFVEDLKDVNCIQTRTTLTSNLVNAYACKEKSMADLIKALSCMNSSNEKSKRCVKMRNGKCKNRRSTNCRRKSNNSCSLLLLLLLCGCGVNGFY